MATRRAKQEERGPIVAVARTLGKAAGKLAALAGVHATQQPTANAKLVKQTKSRLPRKQKKARRKSRAKSTPAS